MLNWPSATVPSAGTLYLIINPREMKYCFPIGNNGLYGGKQLKVSWHSLPHFCPLLLYTLNADMVISLTYSITSITPRILKQLTERIRLCF